MHLRVFPLKKLKIANTIMNNVVVLIPPAVPRGEPPMNINIQLIILLPMVKLILVVG